MFGVSSSLSCALVLLAIFSAQLLCHCILQEEPKDLVLPISEDLLDSRVMADVPTPYQFSCSISTDKVTYTSSDDVKLNFDLTNLNEQALYVLKWHTPLEGMRNRYLRVFVGGDEKDGGKEVPYRGIMAKRGNPSAESYILIEAGETASSSVSLNEGYDTTAPGRYSIQLNAGLFDVVPQKKGEEFKPSKLGHMTSVPILCDPIHFTVEPGA